VVKFVEYYVTSASPLVSEVGYVPLTESEQKLVQQRFAAKTTGTMFDASTSADPKVSLEQRLSGQAK
jgi:hypothetical protein